jgi:hypothetical protein
MPSRKQPRAIFLYSKIICIYQGRSDAYKQLVVEILNDFNYYNVELAVIKLKCVHQKHQVQLI